MPKISRTKEMITLPPNYVPGPHDVICAKGKQAKEHQANRLMRFLVESSLQEYSECPTKLERSFIVSRILKTIRQDGGFVRQINGEWFDVGDRNAREKIGQIFRDSLHTLYKSSTKAKATVRRQRHTSTTGNSRSSSSNNSRSNSSVSSSNSEESDMESIEALPTPSFPIREVSFAANVPPTEVSPFVPAKTNVDLNIQDFLDQPALEPLPLSQALVMNFNESVNSNDSTFAEAMNEMFQSSAQQQQQQQTNYHNSTFGDCDFFNLF